MSQLSAEQLAQRIHDCGLMPTKTLEVVLSQAGGRGRASFNDFIVALLEGGHLTNWQISRVVDGQRRGYFYGEWRVLYLIGAGTFARVYRAAHVQTGDIKAVKVLRQRYTNDLDTRESFLREARMVMDLRHPNIVPIFEVEEFKGRIYMVMDFVEGQNLREYVRSHKKIPYITALKIIRDVCSGLAYAAELKIHHRDMKLSNVLLSSKGQAKLVDFGLATVTDETTQGEKGGPRSIDYAGLERCTGVRRNDTRSDLFFVGCMLYHMVAGVPPLLETRERIKRLSASRYKDVKPITMHEPAIPHRIVVLLHHLMEIDAEKRTQSAAIALAEAESALDAIQKGDIKKYDEALSEKEEKEFAAQRSLKEEGKGKTLLIIESNVKVQDSLRERLKKIGYRVLITGNPSLGLNRFADLDPAEDRPADAVIIGCSRLGMDGINAFEDFVVGDYTSKMPGVLITTEKVAKHVRQEWFNEHRAQLEMPIKFKSLKKLLRKLLKLDTAPPAPAVVDTKIRVNAPSQDSEVETG